MSTFRVIALPTEVAQAVRSTNKDPRYGYPAHTSIASGYGPCRHCLRVFKVGQEQRTLFTYDLFDGLKQVPFPGPVFIHAAVCARYPEEAGYPEDLREYSSVLIVYVEGGEVLTNSCN